MTTFSPRLDLPFLEGAQAQKHITHNEALERLDIAVQASVQLWRVPTPPDSPPEGQCFLVGAAPTGAWVGHAGDIAAFVGGGWLFVTPQTGWRVWDDEAGRLKVLSGQGWVALEGGAPELQNLDGVGVNASSDATNRLAVSSDATLLNHDGAGHQLKINKSDAAATASLLFQSDFAGHAEMGLAGSNDFSVKVSADGSTFTEALRIDAVTGAVSLPATPADPAPAACQILPYRYRYFLTTGRHWAAPNSDPYINNASTYLGTAAAPEIQYNVRGLFLPAGTRVNRIVLAGQTNSSAITDMETAVYFQYGPWNEPDGWGSAEVVRDTLFEPTIKTFATGIAMRSIVVDVEYIAPQDGYIFVTLRAGPTSTHPETQYYYCNGHVQFILPA